jgi:signal transduction histidine kinase
MAISYRIVQSHGGEIEVASRPGAGTTITVSLPARVTAVAGSRFPVASGVSV